MRAERRRTKKLTVAFHFLFANQAAWKCDNCRRDGLEEKRGCKRLDPSPDGTSVIWARKGVGVAACPKSIVTGDSQAFLEEYQAQKTLGGFADVAGMPARSVDAFTLLERLTAKERVNE